MPSRSHRPNNSWPALARTATSCCGKQTERSAADGYRRLPEDLSSAEIGPQDHSRVVLLPKGKPPHLVDLKQDAPPVVLTEIGSSDQRPGLLRHQHSLPMGRCQPDHRPRAARDEIHPAGSHRGGIRPAPEPGGLQRRAPVSGVGRRAHIEFGLRGEPGGTQPSHGTQE